MKVNLPAGKYVIAVSGGVDSMALLDILAKNPSFDLVVAHFDHGIRPDSRKDAEFVARQAQKYKLSFFDGEGKLGAGASEALARQARYDFLKKIKTKVGADGIVTAHHQDDAVETALINILRGTGPKGLAALSTKEEIKRPLLGYTKANLLDYALANNLEWREDSTNESDAYLRNYLRRHITPKLTHEQKTVITDNIDNVAKIQPEYNHLIATIYQSIAKDDKINRLLFTGLPHSVGNELMAYWFKRYKFRGYDRKIIDISNDFIRTARAGSSYDVNKKLILTVDKLYASLANRG